MRIGKFYFLILTVLLLGYTAQAQTTAKDFSMNDCNGQMHNLFSEMDSGNVVIMQFFMINCSSCITAGHTMEPMWDRLKALYPGKVRFYHLAYTNGYTCTDVMNWVNSNSFNTVPFDSGSQQVAYYGGFGMPTVAVVGGPNHLVLFRKVGFSTKDTIRIASAVKNFMTYGTGIEDEGPALKSCDVFPNPATEHVTLSLEAYKGGRLTVELVSITGQKLLNINENITTGRFQKEIATETLPKGVYFLNASLDGELMHSKIMVQ